MLLITEKDLRYRWSRKELSEVFHLKDGERLTPAAKDFLLERKIMVVHSGASMEKQAYLNIPVGVSNRHIHLTEDHFRILFGGDVLLNEFRPLSQPGQFAALETVTMVGPKGTIANVRILGPFRNQTQVEISRTDGFLLGIHPPMRLSGKIKGSPGISIVGGKGSITITEGLIIAKNHVHMSVEDGKKFSVKDGDSLILDSKMRAVIFSDVVVRIKEHYRLEFHIDQDEANAAGLSTGDTVRVIGKNRSLFSGFLGDEQDGK